MREQARVGAIAAIVVVAAAACGSSSTAPTAVSTPTTPTAPPSGACLDTALGVCNIADPGVRHIGIGRAGANGLVVDPDSGSVYVALNGVTSVWCGDRGQFASGLAIVSASGVHLATVSTTPSPVWPHVDRRRRKVYVAASGNGGQVVAHDPASGAIERTFSLGGRPHDLGLDPLGRLMLVSNTSDQTQTWVSLLDVESGEVAARLPVPELPHKVVVDEASRVAYVVSLGAGSVTAVDLSTGTHVRSFSSGTIPQTSAMVYSAARRLLYVGKTAGATTTAGTTIVVLDPFTGQVVGQIGTFTPSGATPTRPWGGFGLDEARGLLYAAMANSNSVAVVDLDTLKPVGLFEVDACPWAVAVDERRGTGYVSSNQAAAVTAFDLAKVARAVGR